MPNLYFCQPHAKNQGMLRAVLTLNDCDLVMRLFSATFVGEEFPVVEDSTVAADFAVVAFGKEETAPPWRAGYYRLDSELNALNEALKTMSV